jgi:hypothetical protein
VKNSKLIGAYVSLVGLPVLALIGTLRTGRRLTAPPFIGGTWTVESDMKALAAIPCAAAAIKGPAPVLAISQSGRYLYVGLGDPADTSLAGSVEGRKIAIRISNATAVAAGLCRPGNPVTLAARIESEKDSATLIGEITAAGCVDCRPVPFRAFRKTAAATPKVHP